MAYNLRTGLIGSGDIDVNVSLSGGPSKAASPVGPIQSPSTADEPAASPVTLELIAEPEYRPVQVEIKRGDAVDSIKFTYTDGTTWSAGHDGKCLLECRNNA